ncbi:MAG: hypothetical protein HOI22_02840 [Tateyamaria sp.]|nr:hypothetical protein [Tateyamaria sp.]
MNLAFDDAILFHRATGVRYSFRGTSQKAQTHSAAPQTGPFTKGMAAMTHHINADDNLHISRSSRPGTWHA